MKRRFQNVRPVRKSQGPTRERSLHYQDQLNEKDSSNTNPLYSQERDSEKNVFKTAMILEE